MNQFQDLKTKNPTAAPTRSARGARLPSHRPAAHPTAIQISASTKTSRELKPARCLVLPNHVAFATRERTGTTGGKDDDHHGAALTRVPGWRGPSSEAPKMLQNRPKSAVVGVRKYPLFGGSHPRPGLFIPVFWDPMWSISERILLPRQAGLGREGPLQSNASVRSAAGRRDRDCARSRPSREAAAQARDEVPRCAAWWWSRSDPPSSW